MLQLKDKKKILIEEEKKTGMYHVQLLKASGKMEKDMKVSPDFFEEVLFDNNQETDQEIEDENQWIWLNIVILIDLCIFCFMICGGA